MFFHFIKIYLQHCSLHLVVTKLLHYNNWIQPFNDLKIQLAMKSPINCNSVVSLEENPKNDNGRNHASECTLIYYVYNDFGTCPVNLHPLFLFWKPGSFCDPPKKFGTLLFSKSRVPNFFSGSQTDPGFQNKNSGCRLTGRLIKLDLMTPLDLHLGFL